MVGLSQAIHQRNYQRARSRALVRLSQAHREHYRELLEEEKARDEQMGKRWIGIDTSTGNAITIESYKDATEGAVDPSDDGTNQSYYGGEE
jgi:hypothetical protein